MCEVNYAPVIKDMTWSYSRITAFEDCPYRWYLKYIRLIEDAPMFFSDYGSFVHKIIELSLNGELKKGELVPYYLSNFRKEVKGSAPNRGIFKNYFDQGLQYLSRDVLIPYKEILGVEKKLDFKLGDRPFTGVLDCVALDGDAVVILDNKSRALKKRSSRKTTTKSDEELDQYLRQLYLYSLPTKHVFGKYPDRLEFNCFRTQELISEPFSKERLEEAIRWATESVEKIERNEDWSPDMDYWKCKHICGVHDECEYFQINNS